MLVYVVTNRKSVAYIVSICLSCKFLYRDLLGAASENFIINKNKYSACTWLTTQIELVFWPMQKLPIRLCVMHVCDAIKNKPSCV